MTKLIQRVSCYFPNNVLFSVYSQKQLTSSGLFNFLYPIIQSRESSYKLKQTACFLLLSLVANNGM